MKVSKKEKKLLIILAIVLAIFSYYEIYSYVVKPRVDAMVSKKNELQDKYDRVHEIINNMENQRQVSVALKSKVESVSSPYYPVLSEEHIIMQIDKYMKECNLEGGVEWDGVVCDVPYEVNSSKLDIVDTEGSMASVAEEYRSKFDDDYKKEKAEGNKISESQSTSSTAEGAVENADNGSAESGENTTNNSDNSSSQTNKDSNKENVFKIIRLQGTIKLYGSYKDMVEFTKLLATDDKKICLTGFGETDLNEEGQEMVKASIGMVAYSLPKIDNEKESYLKWKYNGEYGKTEPFNPLSNMSDGGVTIEKPEQDFILTARSQSSDMSAVSLGKVDDNLRNAYIYSGGSAKENVKIEINEKDGKYYYKCSTNKQSLPSNSNSLGTEFVPYNDEIIVDAISEKRVGNDDKYKVNLSIINNTKDKDVIVNINNDDKDDPRIVVEEKNNNVIVNKK